MKRFAGIITLCLLMTESVNSQKLYQINGDTVVGITIPQMDAISDRLIDCERLSLCDSLNDAKSQENAVCRSLVDSFSVQVTDLRSNNTDLTSLTEIQGQIIRNKESLIKIEKRKNRKNLFIGVPVSFGVGAVVGLLVGLFAIK